MSQPIDFKHDMHSHLRVLNTHLASKVCSIFGGMDKFLEIMKSTLNEEFDGKWDQIFHEKYATKLGNRVLADFSETLHEVDQQVGTTVHKVLHIKMLLNMLVKYGFASKVDIHTNFHKFSAKYSLLRFMIERKSNVFSDNYPESMGVVVDSVFLMEFHICHYNGSTRFTSKDFVKTPEFKEWCPVPIGHWGEKKRSESKKIRRSCDFIFAKDEGNAVLVNKEDTEDRVIVAPHLQLDYMKFMKNFKDKSWQEMKDLVESKRINQDKKWFEQFLKQ